MGNPRRLPKYADRTSVRVAQSRAEIDDLIRNRAEASHYGIMSGPDSDIILFTLNGVNYRIPVRRPKITDDEVVFTEAGNERTSEQAKQQALQKAERQIWRAVHLYIKAVIVAHEAQLFERGMGHMMSGFMMLPTGEDLHQYTERVRRENPECITSGDLLQRLLPGSSESKPGR